MGFNKSQNLTKMLDKFPKGALYTVPYIRFCSSPEYMTADNTLIHFDVGNEAINKIEITDNITSSGGAGIGNFCYKTIDVELDLKNVSADYKTNLFKELNYSTRTKAMYVALYYLTDYRTFVYDSSNYFVNDGGNSNAYPISIATDYEYFKSDINHLNLNYFLSDLYYDWEELQLGVFYIAETLYNKGTEKVNIKGQIVPNEFDDVKFPETVWDSGNPVSELQGFAEGIGLFNSIISHSSYSNQIQAWGKMPTRFSNSVFNVGVSNSKGVTAREWLANLAVVCSGNIRHKRLASVRNYNRFVIQRFGTSTILGNTSATEGNWINEHIITLPWDKVIKFEDGNFPNKDVTNSTNYILPTIRFTGVEKRRLTIVGANSENGILQFNNRLFTRDNLDPNDSNHPNFKKIIRPGQLADGTSYIQKFRSFNLECDGLPHLDAGDTIYLLKEGVFRGETADTTGYTNCYYPLYIGQHIFTYDCGKCTSKLSAVIPKNLDTMGIDIQEKT